jgi:uncharacterized RDD family membrane protein YckC
MGCPQCRSDEISSSGVCLVCGYRIEGPAPGPEAEGGGKKQNEEKGETPGTGGISSSGGEPAFPQKEELPQWRRELSERLQAIKQKREQAGGASDRPKMEIGRRLDRGQAAPPGPAAVVVEKPEAKEPLRRPAPKPPQPADAGGERITKPPAAIPRQKILQPVAAPSVLERPVPRAADTGDTRRLIDNVISRKSAAGPSPAADIPPGASMVGQPREGKLILLSRTLSGLIDLIVIVLCTGGFIIAADYFGGIVFLDSISLVDYSALFLLIFLLYSIFFLAACGQTIGMMITGLRVVGRDKERPPFRRLLGRCLGYLVSMLALGAGLLWSLFDRESLCFHDRVSLTRVVRIHEPLILQ